MAETLGNSRLYRKVKGIDLFAAEGHYHYFYYHCFYSDYHNQMQKIEKKTESNTEQARKTNAHSAAYTDVKKLLKTDVIGNQQILPLITDCDHYITELSVQGAPNQDYRSMKLKAKLEKDEEQGEQISFSKLALKERGCFSFWLIYSSSITLKDAISCAYKLGTRDQVRDTALYVRQEILKAFEEFSDLPWPPTADEFTVLLS